MKINLNSPQTISLLILLGIAFGAGAYGLVTYQNQMNNRSYNNKDGYQFPYDLRRPSKVYKLPGDLEEISGLAYYRNNAVLAIQDERASIYVYDLALEQVTNEVDFGKNRDYEGVAYTGRDVYVLEMDGDLHRVQNFLGKDLETVKIETDFSYRNDTEGVCFDPITRQLLMAPKEKGLEGTPADQVGIYTYDIESRQLSRTPTYIIDQYDLGQMIYGKNRAYKFKPSALAVHPKTGDIYVLASVGKVLIVISRDNEVVQVEMLDRGLLPQPEGITFDDNGDMLISSEGKSGRGVIVRFSADQATLKQSTQQTD